MTKYIVLGLLALGLFCSACSGGGDTPATGTPAVTSSPAAGETPATMESPAEGDDMSEPE